MVLNREENIVKKHDIVWYVGIRKREKGILSEKTQFHIIPNPKGKWAADPFLFEMEDKTYLFVELFCNKLHRGCIAVCEILENSVTPYVPVIIEERHMSYPYIWEDCKGIHICAETGDSRCVCFYRATNFPYKWEKEKMIVADKQWVDTTFFHNSFGEPISGVAFEYGEEGVPNGMVFFKVCEEGVIQSEEPLQTIGKDYERCGGKFIYEGEKLYRIAQNCGISYGHNMALAEVNAQWPYYHEVKKKEVELLSLKHDGNFVAIGTHTYNRTKKYEVVDYRCHEFHFGAFLYGFLMDLYVKFRHKRRK